jgi:hypothetical protein
MTHCRNRAVRMSFHAHRINGLNYRNRVAGHTTVRQCFTLEARGVTYSWHHRLIVGWVERSETRRRRCRAHSCPVVVGYPPASRTLIDWCKRRQDFCSFRVDHIVSTDFLDERYPARPSAFRTKWLPDLSTNARREWMDGAVVTRVAAERQDRTGACYSCNT